jgi:hypothetical protein
MGAALAGKPDVDSVTAARMVRPYAWLLDRVGNEGIRLTGAGYLPPAHVEATTTELGLLEDWMGKGNRELRTDPEALWWHLAERMPPRSPDRCETQAGLIWLLAMAAQRPGDPAEIVALTLAGIGWALADGTPLSTLDADRAAWDTRNVLRRLSGLADDPRHYGAGSPNKDGAAFARAAVSTWPGSDKPL